MQMETHSKLGVHSPSAAAQFSPQPMYDQQHKGSPRMAPYPGPPGGLDFKSELRPAAQTLKQMAEQHQHKTQLGMNFSPAAAAAAVAAGGNHPGGAARNVRSPYGDFSFPTGNEATFMHSPTSGPPPPPYLNKQQTPPYGPQGDMMGLQQGANTFSLEQKRQMAMQQQKMNFAKSGGAPGGPQVPPPQMGGPQQQPFSPYGSPNHGSPQYMARGQQPPGGPQGPPPQSQFAGGSTPPHRPPSLPGNPVAAGSLHLSQSQQMHISQQAGQQHMQVGHGIFILNQDWINVGSQMVRISVLTQS
jgi:hypothetical protein